MPQYEISLSDGRTVTIEADRPPTEEEVLGSISAPAAMPGIAGSAVESQTIGPDQDGDLSRAWGVFSSKIRGGTFLPNAVADAAQEFQAFRSARNLVSPLFGDTEEVIKEKQAQGQPAQEGIIPGIVRGASRIEEVQDLAGRLRNEPNPDDPWNVAINKAAGNLALDIGVGALSPLGMAGMVVSPGKAAAAASPLVLNSIQEASRSVTGDDALQTKIERGLAAMLGAAGIGAATRVGFTARPTATTTAKAPRVRDLPAEQVAAEAELAAPRLEAELGVEAPLTAAQSTADPRLAKMERYYAKTSGQPTAIERMQIRVRDALGKLIGKRGGSVEDAGGAAARELTAGEELASASSRKAAGQAVESVAGEAEGQLSAFTASPEEMTTMGDQVRDNMQLNVAFNRARVDRNYAQRDAAISEAIGSLETPFIKPTKASEAAVSILEDAAKREVPEDTGLVDMRGNPVVTTAREVMPEFLPSFNRIKTIANWDTPQTVPEMQRVLTDLGQAIGRLTKGGVDQFGGGFTVSDLKRLYGGVRQDIDAAMASLGPKVEALDVKARNAYRRGVELQEQSPAIAKILSEPSEGGIANSADIISEFSSGRGKYDDLLAVKEVVPAPTYAGLRRGIVDSLQGKATIPTAQGGVVDLTVLRKNIDNLTPEFQREVFGSDANVKAFKDTLDRFGTAKDISETIGGPVAPTPDQLEALKKAISEGRSKAGARELETALNTESRRIRDYHNEVSKEIRTGKLGEVEKNPKRFVDDFIFRSKSPEEVLQALSVLTPETRVKVQNAAAKRLFESAVSLDESTLKQVTGGTGPVSGERLVDLVMNDPVRSEVVSAVLPQESKALIADYINYWRGIDQAYKMAGEQGLVSSSAVFGLGTSPLSIARSAPSSLFRMKMAGAMSRAIQSDLGQRILKRVANSDDSLTFGIAAEALQKLHGQGGWRQLSPEERMTLTRTMSNYFPQAAVQQWAAQMEALDQEYHGSSKAEQEEVDFSIPVPGF